MILPRSRRPCSTWPWSWVGRPGSWLSLWAWGRRRGCGRSQPGTSTALSVEIKKAKVRFGLPEDTPVLSCYEAGRDGFWLHRYLTAGGVDNQVVDSSSIEVNRRRRRAKSDRLDAAKDRRFNNFPTS